MKRQLIPFTFTTTMDYNPIIEIEIQRYFDTNHLNYEIELLQYTADDTKYSAIISDKNTIHSFDFFKNIIITPNIKKNKLYITDKQLYQIHIYIFHSKDTLDEFHKRALINKPRTITNLPILNQGNYILNNKDIDCFEPYNIKLSRQLKHRVYSFILHKKYYTNDNTLCMDILTDKHKLKPTILKQLKNTIQETFNLPIAHHTIDNIQTPEHYILQFPNLTKEKLEDIKTLIRLMH